MTTRKGMYLLLQRPLAMLLFIAVVMLGSAITAGAAGFALWTTQPDFETNASTTGALTIRQNIDTASSPGDVKIGISKSFITSATINVAAANKIYTTGVDLTSVSVVDANSKLLINTVALPKPAAGAVYNSRNNKLYVGQYNSNQVLVLDCNTDTVIKTLNLGSNTYVSAYNSLDNKVYVAAVDTNGNQTVSILDGASETVLSTVQVPSGSSTATFDAASDRVYLTDKANSYLTILDGDTNQIVKVVATNPATNLLGGNVGLQFFAPEIATADRMRLSWNYDVLKADQNIQFQVRTASDPDSLAGSPYLGPDGTAATWYDASAPGELTTAESDGTVTTAVDLSASFAQYSEIQVRLAYDGITSPALHSVSLAYQYIIHASAGPNGAISPAGDVEVPYGGCQSFTITPNTGYHILEVLVDGTQQGPQSSYNFCNVTAGHTISATFAPNQYPIYASAGPGGGIAPSGTVMVLYGGSQAFEMTPQACYYLSNVTVDGTSQQGPPTPYTFENVTTSHTISAGFSLLSYTVNASAGPGGSISPAGNVQVFCGGSLNFVITPDAGHYIDKIYVDGTPVSAASSYSLTNITANHTIYVTFAPYPYTITASAGPGGAISPNGAVTVYYGASQNFTVTPNPGMLIATLAVDGSNVIPPVTSYSFSNVTSNHTISVTFKPSSSATLAQAWSVTPPAGGYGGAPDLFGNYYGPEYVDGYVYRYDSNHNIDWTSTTVTQGNGSRNSGMSSIVTDNAGNVYGLDGYGYVYKFTPSSTTAVWGKKLTNPGIVPGWVSILAVDNKGYLYLGMPQSYPAPYYLYKLRTSDGAIVWTGNTSLSSSTYITGLCVDSTGKIYMSPRSSGTSYVYKYDPSVGPNAVATYSYSNPGLNGYNWLVMDNADNLYLSAGGFLKQLDTNGNVRWSVSPNGMYTGNNIATDGVNVYLGYDTYLAVFDATTGGLKQTINNVPSGGYGATSFMSTDGYGSVYVHSEYNSSALGPITKYTLH